MGNKQAYIIAFAGEKGGTSKSTLATNFVVMAARQGKNVVLLDADQQETASNWAELRSGLDGVDIIPCVQGSGNIVNAIQGLATQCDMLVIDVRGQAVDEKGLATVELASILATAHLICSPVRPSIDLWTLPRMSELTERARAEVNKKLKTRVVYTQVSTNIHASDIKNARDMINQNPDRFGGLEFLDHVQVGNRTAYQAAMLAGLGVVELPDKTKAKKAVQEMKTLYRELLKHA